MITKMGVPFNGLAGAGFSGSYKGMRFFMKTYDKEKWDEALNSSWE